MASTGSAEARPQRAGMAKGIDEVRPQSPCSPHKNKTAVGGDIVRPPSNFRAVARAGFMLLAASVGVAHPRPLRMDGRPAISPSMCPAPRGGSTGPISRKYADLLAKQLKVKIIVEKY